MSGYVSVLGECVICQTRFSFNPHRVPSVRVPSTGEREPICSECIAVVNEIRKGRGLEPWPMYDDAYDPIPANEL